jgi:hypothetical protein
VDSFKRSLVVVYGPAQDAKKGGFFAKLFRICDDDSLPSLIGGDFNIICRQENKNNDNFNMRWPFIFYAIIGSINLREFVLSGRRLCGLIERNSHIQEAR